MYTDDIHINIYMCICTTDYIYIYIYIYISNIHIKYTYLSYISIKYKYLYISICVTRCVGKREVCDERCGDEKKCVNRGLGKMEVCDERCGEKRSVWQEVWGREVPSADNKNTMWIYETWLIIRDMTHNKRHDSWQETWGPKCWQQEHDVNIWDMTRVCEYMRHDSCHDTRHDWKKK